MHIDGNVDLDGGFGGGGSLTTPDETFRRAAQLLQLGNTVEAEILFRRILGDAPEHVGALHYLGVCRYQRGDYESAVTLIRAALAIDDSSPFPHGNLGLALRKLHRLDEAVASFDQAIARAGAIAAFHNNRGLAYVEMRRLEAALDDFGRAITLQPNFVEAFSNRGKTLTELGLYDSALEHLDRAIALRPEFAEAHSNLAAAYREMGRFADAMRHGRRVLALNPNFPYALGYWLHDMLRACAWDDLALARAETTRVIEANGRAADPFVVLAIPLTTAHQQRCARQYNHDKFPASPVPLWRGECYAHERIRVGYFSADFHNHATAHLIAELLERHDRSRFQIFAFSYGQTRHDAWRRRIENGVDRVVECAALSDQDIASQARRLEIDIVVDLKGYTRDNRLGIFALRPAPVQVSYLGYPGTLGASYMDYILADPTVIPPDHEADYTEKVVLLPHSYQANDCTKLISDKPTGRAEHGLPENGFVYCCFNNSYKISPEVFDIWMHLLRADMSSVLWLFEGNSEAAINLRKEAEKRGVSPTRLIFAPRLGLADHLARHRLADLFLDTFYCNAHTTASDALWAGLPVLTRVGDTFAGRVAASLLRALDLPELITRTDDVYEALALHLSREPDALATLRGKLARHRLSRPLFDAPLFAAHIEEAYQAMWGRQQAGLPPARIALKSRSRSGRGR